MSGYVPTDSICEDAKKYIPFDFLSVPFEMNNPAVAPLGKKLYGLLFRDSESREAFISFKRPSEDFVNAHDYLIYLMDINVHIFKNWARSKNSTLNDVIFVFELDARSFFHIKNLKKLKESVNTVQRKLQTIKHAKTIKPVNRDDEAL